jgi:hypothetical protein
VRHYETIDGIEIVAIVIEPPQDLDGAITGKDHHGQLPLCTTIGSLGHITVLIYPNKPVKDVHWFSPY